MLPGNQERELSTVYMALREQRARPWGRQQGGLGRHGNTPGEQAPADPAPGWVFGRMKAMSMQGGNTNSHMQMAPTVADEGTWLY